MKPGTDRSLGLLILEERPPDIRMGGAVEHEERKGPKEYLCFKQMEC